MVIGKSPSVTLVGTVTSKVSSGFSPGPAVTESTSKPPPRNAAVQSSGRPLHCESHRDLGRGGDGQREADLVPGRYRDRRERGADGQSGGGERRGCLLLRLR